MKPYRWRGLASGAAFGLFWFLVDTGVNVLAGARGWPHAAAYVALILLAAAVGYWFGELYERVHRLAVSDPLTGLANRACFFDLLNKQIALAERGGQQFSLLLFDLDRFKEMNDTCGHLAGDMALRRFGALLREILRTTDAAGRYGGEEFVVLLPLATLEGAIAFAERVREGMKRIDQSKPVTASIGVANYPGDGNTADALVQAADDRMYVAKNSGGNAICARPTLIS